MNQSAAPLSGVTDAEFDALVCDTIDALERQPAELRARVLRALCDPVDSEALLGRMVRYARERSG